MLGRLYGATCAASLRFTQAFHDSRKFPQGVRSPQTSPQIAQVSDCWLCCSGVLFCALVCTAALLCTAVHWCAMLCAFQSSLSSCLAACATQGHKPACPALACPPGAGQAPAARPSQPAGRGVPSGPFRAAR